MIISLSTLWLVITCCVFVACGVVMGQVCDRIYRKARRVDDTAIRLKQCRPYKRQLRVFGLYYANCIDALAQLNSDCARVVLEQLVELWRAPLSCQALIRIHKRYYASDPASEHWLALGDSAVREKYWLYVLDGLRAWDRCIYAQFEQRLLRLAAHNHLDAGWHAHGLGLLEPGESLCTLTRERLEKAPFWTRELCLFALKLMAWENRREPTATPETALRWLTIWLLRTNVPFRTVVGRMRPELSDAECRALDRLATQQQDPVLQVQRGIWLRQEMEWQNAARHPHLTCSQ